MRVPQSRSLMINTDFTAVTFWILVWYHLFSSSSKPMFIFHSAILTCPWINADLVYWARLCYVCSWQLLRLDSVYYFHDLIKQMKGWGYQEGSTLFGFGYDFRQSNRCAILPLWEELQILLVICVENYSWFVWYRFPEHMEGLRKKLETIFEASGGKKVDIVSHCMGGLLVKSFLALHHEVKISFTLKSRR